MPDIEGAGVALHYVERGSGQPLLLVHAMGSDGRAWKQPLAQLAAAARAIAYDRRGYGGSGAPQPYVATTVQEQAEDAAALLVALGAVPAVLVGEGFGALVALELLVRRPELASAGVLADPPLLAFVPEAAKALAAERSLLERALRDGGPQAAITAWLGDAADPALVERVCASQLGFFADYAGGSSWSPARRELRSVGVPVAVVTGANTPSHIVAAADAATRLLPEARRRTDGDIVGAARAVLT